MPNELSKKQIVDRISKTLVEGFELLHYWPAGETIYVVIDSRGDLIFARLEWIEAESQYLFCQDKFLLDYLR